MARYDKYIMKYIGLITLIVRMSSTARTPPPTVSGMNTRAATASMMGSNVSRPSLELDFYLFLA